MATNTHKVYSSVIGRALPSFSTFCSIGIFQSQIIWVSWYLQCWPTVSFSSVGYNHHLFLLTFQIWQTIKVREKHSKCKYNHAFVTSTREGKCWIQRAGTTETIDSRPWFNVTYKSLEIKLIRFQCQWFCLKCVGKLLIHLVITWLYHYPVDFKCI